MSKKKESKLATNQIIFMVFAILLGVTTLITLLLGKASFVKNKNVGTEVSVSGINLLQALFHWKYSSPSYGDIAVPFYYYAKDLTIVLSFFVLVCVILVSACIVISVTALVLRKRKINLIAFRSYFLTSIFLLITFILSLFMGVTKILKVYCGGNKACSMQSIIIVPALTCFFAAIMHSLLDSTLSIEDNKNKKTKK